MACRLRSSSRAGCGVPDASLTLILVLTDWCLTLGDCGVAVRVEEFLEDQTNYYLVLEFVRVRTTCLPASQSAGTGEGDTDVMLPLVLLPCCGWQGGELLDRITQKVGEEEERAVMAMVVPGVSEVLTWRLLMCLSVGPLCCRSRCTRRTRPASCSCT